MNKTQQQIVAENLGTIIANQSLQIASLQLQLDKCNERNASLQNSITNLRKGMIKNESSDNHTANKQKH